MSAHALVVGRFCPPHAGHRLLIDRAAAGANRVTVLALGRSDEPLRWTPGGPPCP